MIKKTAIVIGATGLVGSHLMRYLLEDDRYGLVKVFARRAVHLENAKLEKYIVDFERIESWRDEVTGDELFSALGTTRKQAGSKDAQYVVDFTYQYEVAKAAAENGVGTYVLVSSAGSDAGSRFFYTRMKGELEDAVRSLPFAR
jgi:uncharacterized protein YbjT (DUF2867 family)